MSSMSNAPVMILAGGTGGHIFPGLAVANELRARAISVIWLGSDGGMETRLVPQHQIAIETIAVRGLRGKGFVGLLMAPFIILRSVFQAISKVRKYQPRAVLSFGGFAAGPAGIAAWILRKPLLVHEANRAPGFTNRVLAKVADRVLCGFPDSFKNVPNDVVGNPVRPEIAALAIPEQRLANRSGAIRLLVLGGSQGARAINSAVPKVIAALKGNIEFEIRHQCGEKLLIDAKQAYQAAGVAANVEAFIQDMAAAYGWADIVIGRAGALTVAELCSAGVGSILIPFPGAVDDHQACNAQYLKECGASNWLRQTETLEHDLQQLLSEFCADRAFLMQLAVSARKAALPDATKDVVDIVLSEAKA
jgi:UDP-N-acetylglucosamine--N-acetylmuramyl-(pentapeptide) pyrophosphoryl-undecaprenol N-acetylglucosamine transferase